MTDLLRLLSNIKGDFAESLVSNLFRQSGFSSKIFGAWKLSGYKTEINSDVGKGRDDHPDFWITGEGFTPKFIEVKFRANSCFDGRARNRIKAQSDYWSQYGLFEVVLVTCLSKPYFRVLDLRAAKSCFTAHAALPLVVYSYTPLLEAGWKINESAYMFVENILESNRQWLESD
jgi:hypothetical protein